MWYTFFLKCKFNSFFYLIEFILENLKCVYVHTYIHFIQKNVIYICIYLCTNIILGWERLHGSDEGCRGDSNMKHSGS